MTQFLKAEPKFEQNLSPELIHWNFTRYKHSWLLLYLPLRKKNILYTLISIDNYIIVPFPKSFKFLISGFSCFFSPEMNDIISSCGLVAKSCLTRWPCEVQHARLPCLSLSPGVCSNSRAVSEWCHPTISSSAPLLPSCLHFFQHQGIFQWINSSHQVAKNYSFSFSIGPYSEYSGWFPLALTGLTSLN